MSLLLLGASNSTGGSTGGDEETSDPAGVTVSVPGEGWYIDGVALEQLGRVIENRDGWDDVPGVRGDNATLLGRHGDSWRRKRYTAGSKSLAVVVHGVLSDWSIPDTGTAQRALYERNLDELYRLVAPRHRMLSVERIYADGSRRVADCEVVNPLTPENTGWTHGSVSIEFVIPGGFWRDADPRTQRLQYKTTGADSQTVELYSLRGQTAPCSDAVITVTGPCSGITVADSLTGSGFTYGALTGGQTLTVDAEAFTAVKAGTSVITDLTLYDGQLLEISPAPSVDRGPSLLVSAPGKGTGFKVVVTSRRSWLR